MEGDRLYAGLSPEDTHSRSCHRSQSSRFYQRFHSIKAPLPFNCNNAHFKAQASAECRRKSGAGGKPSGATPVRRFPPPLGSGVKRLALLGRGGECYYFSDYTLQLTPSFITQL
ncbi:MAG: hypothetical protein KME57_10215 [Scytonema hyalinum WJT4-NPBG1]|nr:hypothetical protein [Scytonema hyalinum WJT4-NPBG1]